MHGRCAACRARLRRLGEQPAAASLRRRPGSYMTCCHVKRTTRQPSSMRRWSRRRSEWKALRSAWVLAAVDLDDEALVALEEVGLRAAAVGEGDPGVDGVGRELGGAGRSRETPPRGRCASACCRRGARPARRAAASRRGGRWLAPGRRRSRACRGSRCCSARSSARSTSRRVPSSAMSSRVRASDVHGMLSMTVTSAAASVVPLWTRMPSRRWPLAPGVVTSIQRRVAQAKLEQHRRARCDATVPGRHASVAAITQPLRVSSSAARRATTPRCTRCSRPLATRLAHCARRDPQRDRSGAPRPGVLAPRAARSRRSRGSSTFRPISDGSSTTPPWPAMLPPET